MEFLKRPVAPYVVPVPEFSPPAVGTAPIVIAADPGPAVHDATTSSAAPGVTPATRSPRILELLRVAETAPPLTAIEPFLADPDPKVRRAAPSRPAGAR